MIGQSQRLLTQQVGDVCILTTPFWGQGLVMRLNNMNDGRGCQVDPTHSKIYLSHPLHPPDVIHVIKVPFLVLCTVLM